MDKNQNVLILYSTSGCHLCDQAKSLIDLYKSSNNSGLTLTVLDIADDDNLFEQYSIRIPVVKFETIEQELSWPFGIEELALYIQVHSG